MTLISGMTPMTCKYPLQMFGPCRPCWEQNQNKHEIPFFFGSKILFDQVNCSVSGTDNYAVYQIRAGEQ